MRTIGAKFVSLIFGFVLLKILTNCFSPLEFAEYTFLYAILMYSTYLDIGFACYCQNIAARGFGRAFFERKISSAILKFIAHMIVSVVILCALILIPVSVYLQLSILKVFSLVVSGICILLSQTFIRYFYAVGKSNLVFNLQTCQAFLVGIFVLIIINFSSATLLPENIILFSTILQILLLASRSNFNFRTFNVAVRPGLFNIKIRKKQLSIFTNSIATMPLFQIDLVLLPLLIGVNEYAAFAVVHKLTFGALIAVLSIFNINIQNANAKKDTHAKNQFKKYIAAELCIIIICAAVFLSFDKSIVAIISNSAYAEFLQPEWVILMFVYLFARVLFENLNTVLLGNSNPRISTNLLLYQGLIVIIILIFITPYYGLVGYLITQIISFTLFSYKLYRHLNENWY